MCFFLSCYYIIFSLENKLNGISWRRSVKSTALLSNIVPLKRRYTTFFLFAFRHNHICHYSVFATHVVNGCQLALFVYPRTYD